MLKNALGFQRDELVKSQQYEQCTGEISHYTEEYIPSNLMIHFVNVYAPTLTHAHMKFSYHMDSEKNGDTVEYLS